MPRKAFDGVLSGISRRLALVAYVAIATPLTIIFPLLHAWKTRESVGLYIGLSLAALFLFIGTAVLVAEWIRPRVRVLSAHISVEPTIPIALFVTSVAVYALLFGYFTIENDLFFRRIGFERLVERSLAMPFYALAIHRSFSENATSLLCVLTAILFTVRARPVLRLYTMAVLLPVAALYFTFVLFNNRFQSAILVLCLCITAGYSVRLSIRTVRYALIAMLAVAILVAYGFTVTKQIRNQKDILGCISLSVLNPFEPPMEVYLRGRDNPDICGGPDPSTIIEMIKKRVRNPTDPEVNPSLSHDEAELALAKKILTQGIVRPWDSRLNSLALLVDITRPAIRTGFGYGSFWIGPLSLYYYVFTDRGKYREIKQSLRTNPKVYIASRYLGTTIADTPSSILTDAYANFFLAGFILAGVLIGTALGWIDAVLGRTTRLGAFMLGAYLLERSLYIEKEMLTFVVDTIKFGIIPLISAVLLWRVRISRDDAGAIEGLGFFSHG